MFFQHELSLAQTIKGKDYTISFELCDVFPDTSEQCDQDNLVDYNTDASEVVSSNFYLNLQVCLASALQFFLGKNSAKSVLGMDDFSVLAYLLKLGTSVFLV